jgi:transposase
VARDRPTDLFRRGDRRRDMVRLAWVREQINAIEQARLERLERAPATGRHAMVRMLARVIGVETADMLVQEVLSRNLRDRRAAARYAGLTGSPDESGSKLLKENPGKRAIRPTVEPPRPAAPPPPPDFLERLREGGMGQGQP